MRVYKYNKNGIKITVKIEVPDDTVSLNPNFNETLDFEYLGSPDRLYYDDSKYMYPSLLTYLDYDLRGISLMFDMLQSYKSIKF